MSATPRPQPVVDIVGEAAELAARVSAFVKGIGAVLVLAGLTTDLRITEWAEVAGLVIVAVGELGAYVYTRVELARAAREAAALVTPLESPRDDRGVELVPADTMLGEMPQELADPPGRHAAPDRMLPDDRPPTPR